MLQDVTEVDRMIGAPSDFGFSKGQDFAPAAPSRGIPSALLQLDSFSVITISLGLEQELAIAAAEVEETRARRDQWPQCAKCETELAGKGFGIEAIVIFRSNVDSLEIIRGR